MANAAELRGAGVAVRSIKYSTAYCSRPSVYASLESKAAQSDVAGIAAVGKNHDL